MTERDQLRLLLEVGSAAVSTLDLPELVDAISSLLQRTIPHEHLALALYEKDGRDLLIRAVASRSDDGPRYIGKRLTAFAVGDAFTLRQTTLFREDDLTDRFADSGTAMREAGIRSVCAVPLYVGSRGLGILIVAHREPAPSIPESVALIEGVGRQVAMAVANALALQKIAQLTERLGEQRLSLERRPRADRKDATSTLEAVERTHILRVLGDTNWTLGGPRGAAARLGMKRTTLQSLMRRLGITRPRAA